MKTEKANIHFIGIGGIGISALAKYYLTKGYSVSGSDLVDSEIIQNLKKQGAKIAVGKHQATNIPKNTSLAIYSPAVPLKNPEIQQALKSKISVLSYPQALGELTKTHFTIAVSGTHGKSTTTALIGLILTRAGLDPTVVIGAKLQEFGNSNCRVGKSQYLIIEADEHFGSFLNYWPQIIVLTTIEPEHLDYYKNFENVLKAYKEYIQHLPPDGILVFNQDDKEIKRIQNPKPKTQNENPKIKNKKSRLQTQGYSLDQPESKELRKVLKIPGEHNVSNALAALAVARTLKIPDKITLEALSQYQGAWRRFEILQTKPFVLISDYAHHPTEVKVTLQAAREKYPKKRIFCVFQPHQYQRTYYFFKDFVKILREAPVDKLILIDIYDVPGREGRKFKEKVSSRKLLEKINKPSVIYRPNFETIRSYLKKNLSAGDVLIIMGAGDVYKLTQKELSYKSWIRLAKFLIP